MLLLEAGAAQSPGAVADPAAWFTLAGTSVEWAFETVPQPGTDDAIHAWPRGTSRLAVGGASVIDGAVARRDGRQILRLGRFE